VEGGEKVVLQPPVFCRCESTLRLALAGSKAHLQRSLRPCIVVSSCERSECSCSTSSPGDKGRLTGSRAAVR
jgi:hypothetical protein